MTMSFASSEPIINANAGISSRKSSKKAKRKREEKKVGSTPFPLRLHNLLDDAERKGFAHVISWEADGGSFKVKEPDLMEDVLPKYFKLTKYRSFLRQLQDYGFSRVTWGEQTGLCKHPMIMRGQRHLCKFIYRKPAAGSTGLNRMTTATAQFQAIAIAGAQGLYPLPSSPTSHMGSSINSMQFAPPVQTVASSSSVPHWTAYPTTTASSSSPTIDMHVVHETTSDTASYNGSERSSSTTELLDAESSLPFLQECTDLSCQSVSIPQGVEEAAFEGCRFFTL